MAVSHCHLLAFPLFMTEFYLYQLNFFVQTGTLIFTKLKKIFPQILKNIFYFEITLFPEMLQS